MIIERYFKRNCEEEVRELGDIVYRAASVSISMARANQINWYIAWRVFFSKSEIRRSLRNLKNKRAVVVAAPTPMENATVWATVIQG